MPIDYRWVPVEMCHFSLQEKFYKPLKLYLALQYKCSGKCRLTKSFQKEVAEVLDVSVKTVNRYIDPLLERNWLGYNPKSEIYFIRGFDRIRKDEEFESKSAAFHTPQDLRTTRAFCTGAIICHNILRRRRRALKNQPSTEKPDGPIQRYDMLATGYLQRMIDRSYTTCFRYRREAQQCGYFDMKSVSISHNHLKPVHVEDWRHNNYEEAGRFFYEDGIVYENFPHQIIPKMLFRSRRQK